jgi:hypothetical protein
MADKQGNKIVEVFDENTYNKHIIHIALNLRVDDFDEVFALTGESPHYAILESWNMSLRKWIMLDKNNMAAAVLGVRPLEMFSDIGIPWLLGAEGLNNMKKFFIKVSRPVIEEMKKNFKYLINYVDARYTKAVRWLEWLGFEIEEAAPFGVLNKPFHKIYMECG